MSSPSPARDSSDSPLAPAPLGTSHVVAFDVFRTTQTTTSTATAAAAAAVSESDTAPYDTARSIRLRHASEVAAQFFVFWVFIGAMAIALSVVIVGAWVLFGDVAWREYAITLAILIAGYLVVGVVSYAVGLTIHLMRVMSEPSSSSEQQEQERVS